MAVPWRIDRLLSPGIYKSQKSYMFLVVLHAIGKPIPKRMSETLT